MQRLGREGRGKFAVTAGVVVVLAVFAVGAVVALGSGDSRRVQASAATSPSAVPASASNAPTTTDQPVPTTEATPASTLPPAQLPASTAPPQTAPPESRPVTSFGIAPAPKTFPPATTAAPAPWCRSSGPSGLNPTFEMWSNRPLKHFTVVFSGTALYEGPYTWTVLTDSNGHYYSPFGGPGRYGTVNVHIEEVGGGAVCDYNITLA